MQLHPPKWSPLVGLAMGSPGDLIKALIVSSPADVHVDAVLVAIKKMQVRMEQYSSTTDAWIYFGPTSMFHEQREKRYVI
jgi:hypothetical protein